MTTQTTLPGRFVRETSRDAGWVRFEFSIGDPDLCVELTMRPAHYEAFCRRERVRVLPRLDAGQLEQERRHWHESVPGAQPRE